MRAVAEGVAGKIEGVLRFFVGGFGWGFVDFLLCGNVVTTFVFGVGDDDGLLGVVRDDEMMLGDAKVFGFIDGKQYAIGRGLREDFDDIWIV